jgi:CBS domain-containing protein
MLVKEVMTAPAITIHAHMTVKNGLRLLDEHRVTSLPVTDTQGNLLGIVSEADLLRDAVRHDDRRHMVPHEEAAGGPVRVEDVMSTHAVTVTPDTDLSEAVELMTSTAVKSLPVLEAGRVIGVVSRSDIVHVLARSDEHICAEVDELLRSAGFECEVECEDGVVRVTGADDPAKQRIVEVIAGSVSGVIAVRLR